MTVLHVFDMDGTLLRGTTASLELAASTGCRDELAALEQQFGEGDIDTRGFARGIYRLWGALTTDHVATVFDACPWIGGMDEVFRTIAAQGQYSVVVTMSPNFFAEGLLRRGAGAVVASVFPALPFSVPLDERGILNPLDKVGIVRRYAEAAGLTLDQCVAYGDSMSDVPLFREVPVSLAVNGDAHVESLATLHYRGDDLRQAHQLVMSHLSVS